jgi:hypothetical protein
MSKNVFYTINYYQNIGPMSYILGKESRDEFLTRHNSAYAAIKYINTHTPANAKVRLILFAGRGYYLDRAYEEGPYYGMNDIGGLMANSHDDKLFQAYLHSLNCTHLLVRTNLFEKFLKDNYSADKLILLSQRISTSMNIIYNQDGCTIYEINPRL